MVLLIKGVQAVQYIEKNKEGIDTIPVRARAGKQSNAFKFLEFQKCTLLVDGRPRRFQRDKVRCFKKHFSLEVSPPAEELPPGSRYSRSGAHPNLTYSYTHAPHATGGGRTASGACGPLANRRFTESCCGAPGIAFWHGFGDVAAGPGSPPQRRGTDTRAPCTEGASPTPVVSARPFAVFRPRGTNGTRYDFLFVQTRAVGL